MGRAIGAYNISDHASTGDGQLCAIQLIAAMKAADKKLSELASICEIFPQIMINIKISEYAKGKWQDIDEIKRAIADSSNELGDDARVLVRESGTEPLIRVMIEEEILIL